MRGMNARLLHSKARTCRCQTSSIVYESEAAARRRLFDHGYPADVAAEIAIYLGQATDLPDFEDDIAGAARAAGLEVEFVELDDLLARLPALLARRETTIVWSITDGVRFYRGSAVAALSRLAGFARYGSPATAQHLCQDKFASLALAASAGLAVAPTRCMRRRAGDRGARLLVGRARTVLRQTQHVGRQDRHFRRQPLRRSYRSA